MDNLATQDPAKIILERRKIRRSFEAWCRYRMGKVGMEPAKHHLFIIHTIEKLLRNELPTRKLMLLLPPGSAKSTYTSALLPAWFCNPEQFPTGLMLACSYSYSLAESFGKAARDMIDEEANVLGMSLSKSSAAAGDWRTSLGGGEFCAGVNAGIAGRRARLGLIDDYIGSQEEADSELIRDKNYDWYKQDFVPRLLPNAFRIIIANRRHEDDLVGRLMAEEGSSWTIIRVPMLAEDANDPLGRAKGERLWPEWFTDEQVIEAKSDPRTWGGLYQQRPAPEDGTFFLKSTIFTYGQGELPTNLRYYAASDWAVRKKTLNDEFCHLIGGLDQDGVLWILPDWFWQKSDTGAATEEMFRMQRKYRPVSWWQGRENITGAIGPFIDIKMREENTFINIEELSESADKETKASAIKARMKAGMVRFPRFHPEWERAMNQMLVFPGGTNDDYIDALAKFGLGLGEMMKPSKPKEQWDGVIPEQRITCGWVARSSKRREREMARRN